MEMLQGKPFKPGGCKTAICRWNSHGSFALPRYEEAYHGVARRLEIGDRQGGRIFGLTHMIR